MTGQIFNIQKYVLHDGPGIRTTVFFKGCPLKCGWCHNPESIRSSQELTFNKSKCITCDHCEDFTNPTDCPSEALQFVSKSYTVDELMIEIMKDHVFYDQSGGGVTFSGGEPLLQSDFLLEILKRCKENGLHTAIDTSGFAPWNHIEKLLPYVDLFLYDIKHTDSKKHELLTGVPNDLIISNFKELIKNTDVYIRLPIIKNVNDDLEHIKSVNRLITTDHVKQVNILPYHNYAENKYDQLIIESTFKVFERPTEKQLETIQSFFESFDVEAHIGG